MNLCGPEDLAGVRRDMAKYQTALAVQREREAAAQADREREVRLWYAEATTDERRAELLELNPFLRE